ncbi:MAG: glycosyltransferase family 4 protein [Chlamydiia bacterium]|nr:glycosyltransferase family 4 protein [Chlamydiia bacterium]
MNLLQIVADGSPGGGTTFVLEMINSLESPTLVTQKDSYAIEAAGDVPKYGIDFFSSPLDFRIPIQMQKIIDKVKPDIIHVHGFRAAYFLSFCKKRAPTVYTIHGLHGIYTNTPFTKWGQRRAIRKSDVTIFVSHAEEDIALKHDLLRGANHCVIPNGINIKDFPKRGVLKEKLLGFVGRLSKEKDPLFLLKVMEILGPKGYHLKVIGGGELEDQMKKSPFVTVTGKLSREEALKHLVEVERVLIPSIWEASGLVLLEAMALEIPVIASRIPPFEEAALPGPLATLIDEKDPQKYADAVLAKEDYTTSAKKRFEEAYLWGRCMSAYLKIYANISDRSFSESSLHSPS